MFTIQCVFISFNKFVHNMKTNHSRRANVSNYLCCNSLIILRINYFFVIFSKLDVSLSQLRNCMPCVCRCRCVCGICVFHVCACVVCVPVVCVCGVWHVCGVCVACVCCVKVTYVCGVWHMYVTYVCGMCLWHVCGVCVCEMYV